MGLVMRGTRGGRPGSAGNERLALITVAALAVLGVALVGSTSASASSKVSYAIGKRACALPKKMPSHVAFCSAVRRVVVTKATKGGQPFVAAAGATGAGTIGPNGGLTPGDLGTAYGVTTTGGAGQTLAIVDAFNDPKINVDLQTFDARYGLTTCSIANTCLTVVNQTGGATLPTNDTIGWGAEITLDVEAAHSVCQGCKILLVEATSDSNADLATAENYAAAHADEVSNSFGEPELSDAVFQAAFDHSGKVITAASGDDGYDFYDWLGANGVIDAPSIPASYATVVAVGGTSLYLGQSALRQSETVWNDNGSQDYWELNFGIPLGASGGGCSTMVNAPGWQTAQSVWADTACGARRLTTDVAADADYLTGFDTYTTYDCGGACPTGWQTYGGTSLSSPIIAAMYALAGGAKGIPYPALTAYAHPTAAYDITSGGNGWCDGMGASQCTNPNSYGFGVMDCSYTAAGVPAAGDRACEALKGFDGATGLGTPSGSVGGIPKLFARVSPTAVISGPTSVTHGVSSNWSATSSDPFPGGTIKQFAWNWGDGSAITVMSTGASVAHTYDAAGPHTITLTVSDNYNVTGVKAYNVTAN